MQSTVDIDKMKAEVRGKTSHGWGYAGARFL